MSTRSRPICGPCWFASRARTRLPTTWRPSAPRPTSRPVRPVRLRRGRVAVAAAAAFAGLVAAGGLAAAGVLPGPIQDEVARLAEPIGVHLPDSGGHHAEDPGQETPGPAVDRQDSDPAAASEGSTTTTAPVIGEGQSGTAPGQSGTAPGQSGAAPGQSGAAPGQSGAAPGQSGAAPGQSGAAPGQSGAAPGQSGAAPGQSGAAPGQSGTAPGQSGTAPGQSGTDPGRSGTAPGQTGVPGNNKPEVPPGQVDNPGKGNGT